MTALVRCELLRLVLSLLCGDLSLSSVRGLQMGPSGSGKTTLLGAPHTTAVCLSL